MQTDRSMRWMLDTGENAPPPTDSDRGSIVDYGSLITLDRPLGIFKKVEEIKVEINAFSLKATGKAFTEQILEQHVNPGRMIDEQE